jgi:hypothetical protein
MGYKNSPLWVEALATLLGCSGLLLAATACVALAFRLFKWIAF